MIKAKRGFLLAEETLKIIVAVIAIGFLAYLLFSLYGANQDAKYLELAKESLSSLEVAINAQQTDVMIYNPKGWFILAWPHDYTFSDWNPFSETTTITDARPKSCENLGWSNCICFCDGTTPDKCDSNGVCFQDANEFSFSNIKVDKVPATLKIDYGAKTITN
ncbi:MAG: hypothetical protein KKC96_02000 [Nanoarchaeota archaeon]|nr:hypothetical protein [Nanoarchaeota archaeon]